MRVQRLELVHVLTWQLGLMCCERHLVHTGQLDSLGQEHASAVASPVPRKMMGDLVAATALSAPPPLAWPSILVMITAPTCGRSESVQHQCGCHAPHAMFPMPCSASIHHVGTSTCHPLHAQTTPPIPPHTWNPHKNSTSPP